MMATREQLGDAVAGRVSRRGLLAGAGLTAAAGAVGGYLSAATAGPGQAEGYGGRRVYRGTIVYFTGDPQDPSDTAAVAGATHIVADGALVITATGHVEKVSRWSDLDDGERRGAVDYRGHLIMPGFIDTHIHSGQIDAIASPGGQLLPWLKDFIYPAELKFADRAYAERAAGDFCDILLAAGTTTAAVYTTTYRHSTDVLFAQAHRRDMRMVAGKVLMDIGGVSSGGPVPDQYLDASPQQGIADSQWLIDKWHGTGRQLYCLTPRFAPTSSQTSLRLIGDLYQEYAGTGNPLWLQTHLAENLDEGDLVLEQFANLNPRSYLDVYDKFDLVGPRALFAHCIWLDRTDLHEQDPQLRDHKVMARRQAGIGFCPTSNLFLGSGLFRLHLAREQGIRVGLGTDVGAGTSYSPLHTMNEAYKVVALGNTLPTRITDVDKRLRLTAARSFYLATLGSAQALHLDDRIGTFQPGHEADFVVIDPAATPALARRTAAAADNPANTFDETIHEQLFALATLGDERCTVATYTMGVKRYDRQTGPAAEQRAPGQRSTASR